MRFQSEYTKEELVALLHEKTMPYSFYNQHLPDTMLSKCKGNRIVLWKTRRADGYPFTRLSDAFYGKVTEKEGKTILNGHFRLSNADILSWVIVFLFYLTVVFAVTQGQIWVRLQNVGVMSLVWCGLCAVAALVESLVDRRQKSEVITFIQEHLLHRTP